MPTPFAIRALAPDDAPALAAFAARLFRETYAPTHPATDIEAYVAHSFGADVQRAELGEPGAVTLALVPDGAMGRLTADSLLAYAQLRTGTTAPGVDARPTMEIARFYVDRRWHGRGLAPALMRAALGVAHAQEARVTWLGVWSENARAIAFYRRMGFAIVGTQTFRFGSIVDTDHVMARTTLPDDA